jgi:LysM repeat protein
MNQKENPQSVIDKYSKRQKYMPYVLGGLAGILALAGIFIIISVATGSGNLFKGMFATKTPTPTATFTPTANVPSPTPSMTPTITETPTPAATDTPSGPQFYTVKQGDDCWTLANTFGVDLLVLLAINNFPSDTCPIVPGTDIIIPAPGQTLPTSTPLPADIPRGTEIEYTIQLGETLQDIASRFNSTLEDIKTRNNIKNENLIYVGQVIKVRVNLVTATPTVAPTSTLSLFTSQPTKPAVTSTP